MQTGRNRGSIYVWYAQDGTRQLFRSVFGTCWTERNDCGTAARALIGHYFSGYGHGDSSSLTSSESTFKVNSSNGGYRDANTTKPLLRLYDLNEIGSSNFSSCSSLSAALGSDGSKEEEEEEYEEVER
ncbi:transcription factor bHLH128 [Pyrus ussuriensis x Pyrus communis]|uniref:Transcription factor bHLH128 n=1 Tax=Pyrus ussuriensis x Pyrus communis TaxID=2448454 RepID=A0A5N5IBQ7_9ROSA|nr:transcription factor bHLH128 [Pyrus ussuriensis x Pyrus communis]